MIRLEVIGNPITQGSKRAFVVNGRAVITEGGGKKHKDWRAAVADAAQAWCRENGNPPLITGPVLMRITFGMQKPASAPKRTRTYPIKARSGDVDKLQRSILDSLTGVLFVDDSQVLAVVAVKDWSDPPGVVIEVVDCSGPGVAQWDAGAWAYEFYPARLPDSTEPLEVPA